MVPKIENVEEPSSLVQIGSATKVQIVSGDAEKLKQSPEAYAVYAAGFTTNAAMTLGVETHRIEVTDIAAVTTGRRAQTGMQVTYLVHADDTGKDTRSNADLVVKADTVEVAILSGMSSFTTAAQTSDATVGALAGDDYQDVAAAAAIKEECDAGRCQITSISGDFSDSSPRVLSTSVSVILLISSLTVLLSLVAA